VVVAAGLTLVDPLPEVELNPPGEIEIAVAPLVAQLRLLLVPEFMLAGFAVKDEIVGPDPSPGEGFAVTFPPQLVRPMQAIKRRTRAQRFNSGDLGRRYLR